MTAKGRITAFLASLALAIMLAPAMTRAEEMSYSALMSRIDALEAQLHQQHTDFVAYEMGGAQKDDGDKGNGKGKGGSGRSVYIGYEATVLRPYVSSSTAVNLGATGFDNNYGVGHRFTLGMVGDNGVGARMRYWIYNHGHDLVPPGVSNTPTLSIDMDVFDLEVTLNEELCNFDLLLSGGVRYGRLGVSAASVSVDSYDTYFEGTGPTVSFEAQREVGSRDLYLIGNMRASLLIGEIHNSGGVVLPLEDDEIVTVLESQLGVGWSRETNRGELHVRVLWETQFWMNESFYFGGVNPGSAYRELVASNLGLNGATLAVEFRR